MKPPREHLTTLEDWLNWKTACTIEGCPGDTVIRLARFGRIRLKAALYQIDNPDSPPSLSPEPGDTATPDISHWLRIEAFLLAGHTTIEGPTPAKRFKDRLLEFAGSSLPAFEGGLTVMIKRDLARRLSYEESPHLRGKDGRVKAYAVSRDDDGRERENEATPGSLIPADYAEPASQADLNEITRLAHAALARFTKTLSPDERVILVFDILDIPMRVAIENHLVKIKKSTISDKLQALREKIVALKWPFEPDPVEKKILFRALAAALSEWAQGPENTNLARFSDQAENPS